MPLRVAHLLLILLAGLLPRHVLSQDEICERLIEGSASVPTPFPATQTSSPPDFSALVVQVYTTVALDTVMPSGETHKCEIAYDLWEVDRMGFDIGFNGYPTEADTAIFENARVKYVSTTQDQEIIRGVVREILNPGGEAEPAILALKGNNALFREEFLNLYYVDPNQSLNQTSFDFVTWLTGMHIRDLDGFSDKMIFVSDVAKSDTVAHEFAHALSAGHVNFWDHDGEEWCIKFLPHPGSNAPDVNMECEFTRANYMWAASDADRAELVSGQKQRMMFNRHSVIHDYSPPDDDDVIECPDFNANTAEGCPRIGSP